MMMLTSIWPTFTDTQFEKKKKVRLGILYGTWLLLFEDRAKNKQVSMIIVMLRNTKVKCI